MKAEIKVVTPKIASDILEHNTVNRKLNRSAVEQYARDMQNGLWKLGGQGISISSSGRLLDGQHRLHAIIKSNVPVTMLVCTDVDDENVNFDNGRRRTFTDQYRLNGNTDIITSIKGIGFVKLCMIFANDKVRPWGALDYSMSFEEFDAFLNSNYAEFTEFFNYMISGNRVPRGIKVAPVFSTLWAIYKVDNRFNKEEVIRVSNILKTGITVEDYDAPIIALRDKLILSAGVRGMRGYSCLRETINRVCYAVSKYLDRSSIHSNRITSNPIFDFSKIEIN